MMDEIPDQRDERIMKAIELIDQARLDARQARDNSFPASSDFAVRKLDESISKLERAKKKLESHDGDFDE